MRENASIYNVSILYLLGVEIAGVKRRKRRIKDFDNEDDDGDLDGDSAGKGARKRVKRKSPSDTGSSFGC